MATLLSKEYAFKGYVMTAELHPYSVALYNENFKLGAVSNGSTRES
jgi:hypothetical protein